MGYFPFFVDLEGREGLVVGGGAVALRKLQKLLPYGPRLTVAAPELLAEIEALPGLTRLRRSFAPAMLEGKGFVIAATDDREVNRGIAALCRERGIPVNAVDDKEQCTFLFPALVKRGDLTVGVSTAGASPSAAAWVGRRVSERLPEDFGELLDYLASLRPMVQKRVAEENRAAVFARLFSDCMEEGFPLKEAALAAVLEGAPGMGKVYLVGAGCGAADLITVRGLRLLERCGAVVYDDLLDQALLDAAPEGAEKIYVGKRRGRHSMAQEDINALLIAKAREGKQVVRLKGGDPFVFGRGGEEALALQASISLMLIPQSGQAKLWLKLMVSPPITSTIRSPSARESTFSTESVSLLSMPGFTTSLSTTISILCLIFLSSLISSVSSYRLPSTRTRT